MPCFQHNSQNIYENDVPEIKQNAKFENNENDENEEQGITRLKLHFCQFFVD